MPELDELPPLLAEIAEVIGAQAATILAENKGGRVVYIPAQADADHWLSKMIGHDLANKLCALYRVGSGGTQGTSITIPMARYARRAMVWEDVLALGLSVSETATRMGCHVRTVHRYRAKLGYSDGVSAPSPR